MTPPPPLVPRPPIPLPPPGHDPLQPCITIAVDPTSTAVVRDLITRTGPHARLPVVPTVTVHLNPKDPPTRQLLDLVPDLGQAVLVAADFVYSALYGTSSCTTSSQEPKAKNKTDDDDDGAFNYSQASLAPTTDAFTSHSRRPSLTVAAPPRPPPTTSALPAAPRPAPSGPPPSLHPPFPPPASSNHACKPLKSQIALHLVPNMPGVADTSNPTPTTATLRFSTSYLARVFKSRATPAAAVREFYGVLVHELVHAYQGNGLGTAPWAWVEGVADWVRLRAGLPAEHWRRKVEREAGWQGGYEATGYFLDWVGFVCGDSREVVQEMNRRLVGEEWGGEDMWVEETGRGVDELWDEYCEYFGAMREMDTGDE